MMTTGLNLAAAIAHAQEMLEMYRSMEAIAPTPAQQALAHQIVVNTEERIRIMQGLYNTEKGGNYEETNEKSS